MATEILAVPEECLPRVIEVIRQGLATLGRPRKVKNGAEADALLRRWCDEEEEYLERLQDDDDSD